MKVKNWIFVTGAPRSGTTFVGKVLSLPITVDYIHEPFNPDCGVPGVQHQYIYRAADAEKDAFDRHVAKIFSYDFTLRTGYFPKDTPLKKLVKFFAGSRGPFYLRLAKLNPFHRSAVIKDPLGCLLTEYLADNFGVKPIVVVRHPLAFVASTQRLGWQLGVSSLRDQAQLIEDYFQGEEGLFTQEWPNSIEAAAVLWRCLNKVLLLQAARHPEWMVVTHEQLSANPGPTFRKMYTYAGLSWTPRIAAKISGMTKSGNRTEASTGQVQDFKRNSSELFTLRRKMLNPDERLRVFELTKDIALQVYPEDSFALDGD